MNEVHNWKCLGIRVRRENLQFKFQGHNIPACKYKLGKDVDAFPLNAYQLIYKSKWYNKMTELFEN